MSQMQPGNQADDPLQQIHNPLAVMQPGERIICEVKRHPIGIFGVYTVAALIVGAALAAAILVPVYLTDLSQQAKLGIVLASLLAIVITLLYAYIAVVVYTANRWIVTSDSITEVSQSGLFNKHVSQLSLSNLEDVTVGQDGVLPAMLNYGVLRVETAGERSKFIFPYCPNPNEYARKIIAAHEEYITAHPEER